MILKMIIGNPFLQVKTVEKETNPSVLFQRGWTVWFILRNQIKIKEI
jgi:hypothetical protein